MFKSLGIAVLLGGAVGCTGVLNKLEPDGGFGSTTGSSGTSASSSSGSSGSSSSGAAAGFSLRGGAIEVIPGLYPTGQYPITAAYADGGNPDELPIPYSLTFSGTQPGGPISASIDITASGNSLSWHIQGSATSTVMDQASAVLIASSYNVCFTSPGASTMDFVYTGSGPVNGSGVFDSVATYGSGGSTMPGNGAGATDTGSMPMTGWMPASVTTPGLTAQNGTACDSQVNIASENVTVEGGEVDNEGKIGSATADVVFTVTVTVH